MPFPFFVFPLLIFLSVSSALAASEGSGPVRGDDGRYDFAASGDVLISAEELIYDRPRGRIEARGRVELSYAGRLLVADSVLYEERSGLIRADGNIKLYEPSGIVLTARRAVFMRDWTQGATDWPVLIWENDARLAARAAQRRNGVENRLLNAVYSPCKLCSKKENAYPLWQIRAQRVFHDQASRTVSYRDAFFEIFGVPVFYLPYFWHPSPEIERQTGLLKPGLHNSKHLGFELSLPLFLTLGPHANLTFEPIVTSKRGVIFGGDLHHIINSGWYRFSGTATWPSGRKAGERVFRGHLFGRARFALGKQWQWGFNLQLTTDNTYLRLYDFSRETNLVSLLFTEHTSAQHRFFATGYIFDNLLLEDEADDAPDFASYLDYIGLPERRFLDGYLSFRINGGGVFRNGRGRDQGRLSFSTSWERLFSDPWGGQLSLFVNLRGDLYRVEDVDNDYWESRILPLAGARWHFPLIRHGSWTTQIISPIVQLVYTGNTNREGRIAIEDGPLTEIDDSNFFSRNRFAGFDQWETGTRLDTGLLLVIQGHGGSYFEALVGQSFRFDTDSSSTPIIGISDNRSDYIGQISFFSGSGFKLTQRFRFDDHNLALRRNEIDIEFSTSPASFFIGYAKLQEGPGSVAREEIHAGGVLRLFNNLKVYGGVRRDIGRSRTVSNQFGLRYQDECLSIDLSFEQDFTRERDIDPDTRIRLKISLTNLGSGRLSGLVNPRSNRFNLLGSR